MTFHLVFHRSMALHLNHLIFLTSYAFGVFFLAAALHPAASTILATTMFVYFWLLHLRSRWYVLLSSCLIAGGVWILALCTVRQDVFGVRRRRLVVSFSGGFIATWASTMLQSTGCIVPAERAGDTGDESVPGRFDAMVILTAVPSRRVYRYQYMRLHLFLLALMLVQCIAFGEAILHTHAVCLSF